MLIIWSFALKEKQHKFELFNSKLSGKKKLLFDAKQISKEKKSSPDYKYTYRFEGISFTIKQQSTEIFDLLINNISFDNLMQEERRGGLRSKRKIQSSSTYQQQQYPSSTSSSSSSSYQQRMKQDEEYARYLQSKYNKEALSSQNYYQSGNYKKQPSSSAQYDGYRDEVVNYKNIDEMKRIQRSNQQSTETFQHNQNILSNIDNVFGDSKKDSGVNVQHNMNILGNLDMDNILGNNSGNAGMFDFGKDGNNLQNSSFQNNQQQQRIGNVGGGFMDFNIGGVNNNNNNNNNYMNNNGNNNQQMNMNNNFGMNNNYNNNNQFGFDNNNNNMNNFNNNIQQQPSNQMQFNYNNNNNNNFQFDNKMNNMMNNNQNYLQNQQQQPQNQMMPNPTNFMSQPIQQPVSQDFNLNPNPSSFQTINQPQLTSPTNLMNDSEPNTFAQNPQQQQQQQLYPQLNDTNPPISTNPTSTNTNAFQMNNPQPPKDFKSKLMSTGLVNIDNLLGDNQVNPNFTYNFNTSPLSFNNNPSTNQQQQQSSSPFDF